MHPAETRNAPSWCEGPGAPYSRRLPHERLRPYLMFNRLEAELNINRPSPPGQYPFCTSRDVSHLTAFLKVLARFSQSPA
jgi:hypothetical protein